jgi:hypothetical protein
VTISGVMRSVGLPGYGAGLSNQRIALEVAVAVAHLADRRLELPRLPPVDGGGGPGPTLRITDLMEIPVPCRTGQADGPSWARWSWPPVSRTVLLGPGVKATGPRFAAFANGRRQAVALDRLRDVCAPARVWIDMDLLALYSYAFLLEEGDHLHPVMARVRPREPYRSLAHQLADRLGEFDCLHLRLGDFVGWAGAPRTAHVTAAEIQENLGTVIPSTAPMVILSDSPRHPLVRALCRSFPAARVFEDWLDTLDGPTMMGRPLTPAEVGLVGQLVASRARTFVGTMCSTFTALIQRDRGARTFLFAYNQFPDVFDLVDCALQEEKVPHERFSWQRLRRKAAFDLEAFSWFREWPEAVPSSVAPGSGEVDGGRARVPLSAGGPG